MDNQYNRYLKKLNELREGYEAHKSIQNNPNKSRVDIKILENLNKNLLSVFN